MESIPIEEMRRVIELGTQNNPTLALVVLVDQNTNQVIEYRVDTLENVAAIVDSLSKETNKEKRLVNSILASE